MIMENTVLLTAVKDLISRELSVDLGDCSGCDLCFLYSGSYVEVKPSEYISEQELPYFNVQRAVSERPSDVCIFSLRKGLDWDFYVVRTSVLDSCFGGQSAINLAMIEPFALHVKTSGIKQAVDLAVKAA